MLWERIRPAISLQLAHAGLSVIWNLAGLALIAQGSRAPGPTASLGVAAFLLIMAAGLVAGARRSPPLYVLASLVVGLGALWAVIQAFQLDPSLWPSSFWRYAGVVLNGGGVLGASWGIQGWLKWRRG